MQSLPLLPTTVIGSYATPSWLWTAMEEIKHGRYGTTDLNETYDDAVRMAIGDQERAGVDIISDGEMRRFFFVQNFYRKIEGLEELEPFRKTGLYAYDSVPRYRPVEKITVPHGLGIVEEFTFLKENTQKRIIATCPGPLTLTIHLHLRKGGAYADRLELANDLAGVVNAELKALVEAGADYVQIDEPSSAIIPGDLRDWIALINRAIDGVNAKIGLHICFGNLLSRPRGKRTYRWMFPALLDVNCHRFLFEFANRELSEIEMWKDVGDDREFAAGLVDVKSFYVESPEDVAERIRTALNSIPAEKLYITPDCGFFPVPRWLAFLKLKNMVAGTKIVRKELGVE
ncbi:MAG: methionine synthase [Candidatus Latescibacteria bacterium]|nr:methionine synthase [Candidatus Latescibacterota bacterium]